MKHLYQTDGGEGLDYEGAFKSLAEAKARAADIMREAGDTDDGCVYIFFISDTPLKELVVGWTATHSFHMGAVTKEQK